MEIEKKNGEFSRLMSSLEQRGIVVTRERQFDIAMEKGRALNRIHRDKLYKEKYHSFNSCVEREFGFTSQQARNLMAASETYDELRRNFSVLPGNAKMLLRIHMASRKSGRPVDTVWASMMDKSED